MKFFALYMPKLIVYSAFSLLSIASYSQTNTWTGASSNNWNTNGNWSLGIVPTNAHNVVININAAISVNTSPTINSLTISGSAVVTFTSSGGGRTLTIDNTGNSIGANSSLTLQGSTGSGTRSMSILFTGASRTMSIAGTLVLTDVGEGSIYNATNSITIVTGTIRNENGSGGTVGVITSTATNLVFSSGGTYEHALDAGNIPDATWNAASTCNVTGVTGSIPGNNVQSFGNFIWNCPGQSGNETFSDVFVIQGDFTIQNTNGNDLRTRNDRANIVGGNYIQTGGIFSLRNNNAHSLTVGGDFILSGGTFENAGDNSPGGVLNVAGNFYITGGTLDGGNLLNIFFDGSGTQVFRSGATVTGTTNYTVNSGSTLQMDVAATTVSGTTFTLSSGATLGIRSTVGITASGAIGNIQTSTRTFNAGANYIYNGTANQATGTGFPNNLIGTLTINNPGNEVILSTARTIASGGNLTLTNGLLTTTSTNLITIAAGGSTNGASNSSFVNGPMAKLGTTAFTFPVGKLGAGIRTIGISAPSPSTTFTAEFMRAPAPSRGLVASGISQVSFCEYWTLARSGSANVNVTLSWSSFSPCNSALYVTNLGDLRAARWNGINWVDQGGSGSGSVSAGTITSSNVSDFSNLNFALGSAIAAENPLPVKFTDIKAFEKENGVQIEWTNQTESDIVNYEVEKSVNGRDFTSINNIAPRSNLYDKESYIGFDASPANGSNFYRIKANETTGKSVYSNIVKVVKGQKQIDLIVYPNPVVGGNVTINFSAPTGRYIIELFNAAGQRVVGQQLNHQGGTVAQTIPLPVGSKAGMYSLRIIGDNYKANKMLIVQ